MSYEIPQKIAYKEKIVFGLTFQQLLYVIIFFPIALFFLFKLPLHIVYRIALSLIPTGLACVFMFTKLPKLMMNWYRWLWQRNISLLDDTKQFHPKMKKYLQLDKVEGEVLYLK